MRVISVRRRDRRAACRRRASSGIGGDGSAPDSTACRTASGETRSRRAAVESVYVSMPPDYHVGPRSASEIFHLPKRQQTVFLDFRATRPVGARAGPGPSLESSGRARVPPRPSAAPIRARAVPPPAPPRRMKL